MLRIAVLGSGSRGNALWVESAETRLLIDNGFSLKELTQRLARIERDPAQLDAVFVTHEHQDHIGGVGPLARRHGIPVFMSRGTQSAQRTGRLPEVRPLFRENPLGDLLVEPYHLSHDAAGPVHYVVRHQQLRVGFLSDSGQHDQTMRTMLRACDALFLEANHDAQLLAEGEYPWPLKQRVGGPKGHLNNVQFAELVAALDHEALQHLVALHLSEKHNTPELVRGVVAEARTCAQGQVAIALQDEVSDWFEVV